MNIKYFLFFSILSLLLLQNCREAANNKEAISESMLTIATAANVQFAMQEIVNLYETTYDENVGVIIGSSGKLTAQIKQGAPYDILVSANMKYPNYLYQEGHATSTPKIYAYGKLVLWTMQKSLLLDEELISLIQPSIRKIGIANPKNAPYGAQAIEVFKHFGIYEQIKPKLVYGESIAQTNQYILSHNCEVGITAKSVVTSPKLRGKGKWIDIPENAYQAITQGVVITKYGATHHGIAAKNFYNFLFSPPAKRIFEQYGYRRVRSEE